jgi:type II secretory pathway component PulM
MNWLLTWRTFVNQRSPREQAGITAAVWLIGIGLVWQFSLAPAWQIWRDSRTQLTRLTQQHAEMLALQDQALQLQTQSRMSTEQSARVLIDLCAMLGDQTQTHRQGNRFTVHIKGIPPMVVAQVWEQARSQAQAVLLESHLQRQGEAWDGQWTWTLPESKP